MVVSCKAESIFHPSIQASPHRTILSPHWTWSTGSKLVLTRRYTRYSTCTGRRYLGLLGYLAVSWSIIRVVLELCNPLLSGRQETRILPLLILLLRQGTLTSILHCSFLLPDKNTCFRNHLLHTAQVTCIRFIHVITILRIWAREWTLIEAWEATGPATNHWTKLLYFLHSRRRLGAAMTMRLK